MMGFRPFVAVIFFALMLSGCVAVALEEADLLGVKRTNVADYAYSAADVLLDEAVRQKRVSVKTPIGFERLAPLQGLDPRGRLAILLPEHMGTRIAERGYTAIGIERRLKPEYLIVGTYTLYHPYIQVSVRMVRADNRALVSATAFKMPLTRNLRDLVSLPPIGVSFTDEEILKAQQRQRLGEPNGPIPAHKALSSSSDDVVLPPLPSGQITPSNELPIRVIP